ncbi:hypothetical protein INS49_003592 [Diaporthe citri]|uniref:uncharacterized protein n=1 Tax=Diaporthe citri TaxID=83186 RepID=UPI001C821B2D|nr:uncharacterized protein INS49_003592 [Diaporthe citri]KAG6355630.1 hypothetical protein INS49_003592 [Diaporthe citri]
MLLLPSLTAIFLSVNICLGGRTPSHGRREDSSTTKENATSPRPTMCGDIIDYVNDGYNLFYAVDVLECLVSVPFNKDVALRFVDFYNTTMQFQSTLSYLRNPPPTYQQPSVDFENQLENIKTNVISGYYRNQYAFEADIQHLVQSLHDDHVSLVGGALSAFSFGSNIPLMTLSVDGVKIPEVYFRYDVQNRLQYPISPIAQINGEDAIDFLGRFAALNVYGSLEPHGDWNKIMYNPVQDILDIYDVFSMNAPFYSGDSLEFTMANGTNFTAFWTALYTNPDFTGPLTTGGDYYNYFVLGLVPASYDDVPLPCAWEIEPTDRCPGSTMVDGGAKNITSWSNKTHGSFPADPTVAQSGLTYGRGGGTVTGYIFDDVSVGVLSIPSFVGFGLDIRDFSDTVGEFILTAQKKNTAKIVIDLQGNTGGLVELAFVTFGQFFPQHYPFAGSQRRNHKLADVLGTSLTEYWTELAADDEDKSDLAANEWVITDRLNAQTRQNFTSWAEYFGPRREENGDTFSLVEQYDLANRVFDWAAFQQWAPIHYLDDNFNSSALPPWASQDVVILTDGACSSTCTIFVEMMSHQAGVRTVVVGGRPEPGPMQATSGSRGASAYSAQYLDEDIAVSSSRVPHGTFPELNNETQQRDSGMFLITANFNLRDQVRPATDSGPPLQFRYEAADCRLYWTLENALNVTRLWYDAAGAIWGLGLNSSCVSGSIGYASHGVNATTTLAAPENKATQVPSLPALEWNNNVPTSELEDFGLVDSPIPPTSKYPESCPIKDARAPGRRVCVDALPYTCENGDVIAVAGLIERILAEVKSYREAPLHFRRLAIELDFLGQVCNQVFTLQPTLSEERSQIERIRAIAMHCLGPLRAFEDKMRSYDNTFGIHGAAYASGVAAAGGLLKVRNFKKRLHWSAIARHEVAEIRAVLTSEILAINTLVTIHKWSSLRDQGARSEGHAKQLKQLLDTTAKASAEFRKSLIDARLASENLERVIKTVQFTQSEQLQILRTIKGISSTTYYKVQKIHRQQRAYAKEYQKATSAQITRFFSFKQHMEQWIKTIVEHCKQIIAMVQRNTQLLLSMHGLLAKLETLLAGSRVDLPSIVFENVLGIRTLLPFQLCDTWEGFTRLLGVMFYNQPGSEHVAVGKLLVMRSKTNRIIKPKDWSLCVVPGDQLSMSVVMERFSARTCPRCFAVLSASAWAQNTGTTCPDCDLWLSTHGLWHAASGVSSDDEHSPVPMPLPEKIQFRAHTSHLTDWKLISVREQSLSQAHQARFRRRRLAQTSGAGPAVLTGPGSDPSAAAIDDVESFRRIHVQPYNGNFLRALFEIGENLRTLVIDMLATDAGKNELINAAPHRRQIHRHH